MLKGETTIELTDVHTGEKEEIKSENMFTNALQNIFDVYSKVGLTSSVISSEAVPILNNALGGIMLFDSELDENVNNTVPPSSEDAECVAYANVYVNNTSDVKRGTINRTESGNLEDGYRFVWDFATSQGNGQIASAALTTKTGGVCGATPNRYAGLFIASESDTSTIDKRERCQTHYLFGRLQEWKAGPILDVEGSDTSVNISNISLKHSFSFDVDNLCFHMAKCEAVDGKLKLFLFDLYMNLSALKMNADPRAFQRIKNCRSCEICNDGEVFGDLSKLPVIVMPPDENFCYLVKVPSTSTLAIAKVNRSSMHLEFCKSGDISPYSFGSNGAYYGMNDYDGNLAAALNKQLYLQLGKSPRFLKINTDNLSEKKELVCEELGSGYTDNYGLHAIYYGKRIIFPYKIIENDKVFRTTFGGGSESEKFRFWSGNIINGSVGCFIRDSYYDNAIEVGVVSNFMATINNLPSPVVKTADKTMKITYIVRDVDETV